jgi:hypothetical protein
MADVAVITDSSALVGSPNSTDPTTPTAGSATTSTDFTIAVVAPSLSLTITDDDPSAAAETAPPTASASSTVAASTPFVCVTLLIEEALVGAVDTGISLLDLVASVFIEVEVAVAVAVAAESESSLA